MLSPPAPLEKCRLFLACLPALMAPGGLVVFISPFSWLPQYTPKEHWLGGVVDASGAPVASRDVLVTRMLALGFKVS